jgi:hypothetical protein
VGEDEQVSRLTIVVPLQQGTRERARALLAKGPPFDPEAAGLERHQAFVTDDEAIFVFESNDQEAVMRLAEDPSLWAAAAGWSDLVAGPPRIAEDVYSWARSHPPEDVSYESTPGPGDSEGGDVFPPFNRGLGL